MILLDSFLDLSLEPGGPAHNSFHWAVYIFVLDKDIISKNAFDVTVKLGRALLSL